VASAAQLGVAGQDGDDGLRLGGCDEVAGLIPKADDAGGVGDVDPLRICTEGVESDAEWVIEAAGEGFSAGGVAVGRLAAQDDDFAGGAVGDEEVAVGRGADQTRLLESLSVDLHLEARRRDGPCAVGTGNQRGAVVDRLVGMGFGQVGDGQLARTPGAPASSQ